MIKMTDIKKLTEEEEFQEFKDNWYKEHFGMNYKQWKMTESLKADIKIYEMEKKAEEIINY